MKRRSAVVATILLGGLVLLSSVPTWVWGSADSALGHSVALSITGTDAAPGVAAAGLALLAAGVAAGLVGRAGRWIVVAGVAAASLMTLWSAIGVLAQPRPVALRAAAASTGVPELSGEPTTALWPWAAALLAVAGLALSIVIARASAAWHTGSRRHERASGATHTSVESPGADADRAGERQGEADAGSLLGDKDNSDVRIDNADLWDAQTRGDDEPDRDSNG